MTIQYEPSSSTSPSLVAPSDSIRSTPACTAARFSSMGMPGPWLTRMSRCSRFFPCFGSGTRWKKIRGPTPSGSTTALAEFHSDSGTPQAFKASGQVANPSGGCSISYSRAFAQNEASAAGSEQSMTICGLLPMTAFKTRGPTNSHGPAPPQRNRAMGPGDGSGAGRREVVDGHAADGRGGVRTLDPVGDLTPRARSRARSAPHAVAGDEVVDEPLLHPFLELRQSRRVVRAGEPTDRH